MRPPQVLWKVNGGPSGSKPVLNAAYEYDIIMPFVFCFARLFRRVS